MKFTKMHGASNDYFYVNMFEERLDESRLGELTMRLSDRHTGIGSDGMILVCPSEKADFRMRMFNACDGSEAEMCGNGIRCVGKYVYDHALTAKTEITVETLGGIKRLKLLPGADGKIAAVRVDMGAPRFAPAEIPVDTAGLDAFGLQVQADGRTWTFNCLSMGNPHAVTIVDDPAALDLEKLGPPLETHPVFPRRSNIEFARVNDRGSMDMRVWERGSGETLACGTGACATAVAGIKLGLVDSPVDVHLRGGTLSIEWDGQGSVYMTGPAAEVFTGTVEI